MGCHKNKTYIRIKYTKTLLITCILTAFLILMAPKAYSIERPDLTVTNFLDTLSFNYKGFDIKLKEVLIGETYDDNVTFAKKNEIKDFINNIRVGVGVRYEDRTKTIEFIGDATKQTFAKNYVFNNITQNAILNFKNEFSNKSRMNLKNIFTHSDAPIFFQGEEFFGEQLGRPGGRFDYFKNRFTVDYSYDVARQLTIIGKYMNDMDAFSGIDAQGSFLNKVGIETNYILKSKSILLFAYEFANRRFEDGASSSIHSISPGIRQYITKKLYIEGSMGVAFIDAFGGENLTEPFIKSSLVYAVDSDMTARLSFEKKHNTNPYSESIFETRRTSLAFTRQFLERLQGSILFFYGSL